jgi:hypothetical protein
VKLTTHQAIVRVLSRQWMAGYRVQIALKGYGFFLSESSVTRRIRELKAAHYLVEKRLAKQRNRASRLYEYRIVKPKGIK